MGWIGGVQLESLIPGDGQLKEEGGGGGQGGPPQQAAPGSPAAGSGAHPEPTALRLAFWPRHSWPFNFGAVCFRGE